MSWMVSGVVMIDEGWCCRLWVDASGGSIQGDRTRNLHHIGLVGVPPVRRASDHVDVARRRGRRGRSRSGQHLPNCRSPAAHRGCSTEESESSSFPTPHV